MKKKLDVVLFTCTPIKHNNKTPFMENSKTKCDNKNYKRCHILKLEIKMKLKIKWIIVPTLFI